MTSLAALAGVVAHLPQMAGVEAALVLRVARTTMSAFSAKRRRATPAASPAIVPCRWWWWWLVWLATKV